MAAGLLHRLQGGALAALTVVLVAKRLEDGEFHWPKAQDAVLHVTAAQLSALLEGLDWRRVHAVRKTRVPALPG